MAGENDDLSQELDEALEAQAAAAGEGGTDGQGNAPADGGGSSAPQTQTEDEGLLGVVRDAAKPKPADPAASSAEGAGDGQAKPGDGAPTERKEDYSDVPFNKHPRFRQLLSERNAYKPDAEKYRQVDTFIRDNGLSNEEAANLLTVGAVAKTDPARAWEMARPWVENLLKAAGEVLPQDLVDRVKDGTLTHEAALEVSRSRATVQSTQAARGFEEQRRQRQGAEAHASSIESAAQTWEDQRRERDPNFDAKVEAIHRELAWRHRKGDVPQDAAGVTAQLNDVYKGVNAAFKSATPTAPAPGARPAAPRAPAKPPVKPVVGGSVAAGQAKAAPKSMLEVVQSAAP